MDTKKHIVIIDDNEDLLMMLEALLKTKGYKVSLKEDVNGIGEFLTEVQPDIILMDMLLSGADGREICKTIKADTALADIPLLMLSAYPQAQEECLAAGANGFIEKPFDMKHLLDTLSAF
jgi:CheY-like chemotaxis protein